MTERIDYHRTAPEGFKGFTAAHAYLQKCSLPEVLINLVYLRVSLINGCSYCIDKHSRDLLKQGVSIEKLVLVPVWSEAGPMFSAQERAAFAWAERLTHISQGGVSDAEYGAAAAQFGEKELTDLTYAVSLMNALNRLAISFHTTPAAVKALER